MSTREGTGYPIPEFENNDKLPPPRATKYCTERHENILYDCGNAFADANGVAFSKAAIDARMVLYEELADVIQEYFPNFTYRYTDDDEQFWGCHGGEVGYTWRDNINKVVRIFRSRNIHTAPMKPMLYQLNNYRNSRFHFSRGQYCYGLDSIWEVDIVRNRQHNALACLPIKLQ